MVRELKALLEAHHIRPSKGLGQHFLVDPTALERIIAAADLTREDVVVEVGPGPGALTERLAQESGHVVAVELDPRMVALLRERLAGAANVHVIEQDILQVNIPHLLLDLGLFSSPSKVAYKIVANLPYYITSAVLRHVLESDPPPRLVVVTVQREVAQRIVAGPGAMSLLAVSVQFYGRPRIVAHIPAGAFYPAPKVDSAVVRIDVGAEPPVAVEDVEGFFEVVRAGFGQRRKQLKNALAHGLHRPMQEIVAAMEKAGIDPSRRAQTLSVEEWAALYRALRKIEIGE